jgi:hypothetical protein
MSIFGKGPGSKQSQGASGGRPMRGEPYRGRYRVNPDRSVDVWNGTRYEPRTSATIAPEAADLLQTERAELAKDNLAVQYADEFLQLNSRDATGAPWHGHLPFQDQNQPLVLGNPNVQSMVNIQNRFVRSNIREGTSGSGNTGPEQTRIERSGPSVSNEGPANRTVALNLQIDRDLRLARISAMEEWARDPQRRSLEGFEQWWGQNQRRLRSDIQRRYEATNGPVNNQGQRSPPGAIVGAIAGGAARGVGSFSDLSDEELERIAAGGR